MKRLEGSSYPSCQRAGRILFYLPSAPGWILPSSDAFEVRHNGDMDRREALALHVVCTTVLFLLFSDIDFCSVEIRQEASTAVVTGGWLV
jgi:hypothetical protein